MAAAAQELRLKEQGSITQGATPKSGGTTYNLNWCCTTVWLVFSDNTGMYSWLSPGSVQLQDYCIRPVWVPGTVSAGLYCKGGRTCTFLCPRLIRARRNLALSKRMAYADTPKGADATEPEDGEPLVEHTPRRHKLTSIVVPQTKCLHVS